MRQTLFYLLVALLAFGTGLMVVSNFYWKISENLAAVQLIEEIRIDEVKVSEGNFVSEIPQIEFSCEDEAIKTVWKMLEKNKLFIADALKNVIKPNQIKDCRELFEVKPISLSDNESSDFIVKGNQYLFCDSGGDCQTWIVAERKNRYEIVFNSTTGDSTTKLYPHNEVESLQAKTRGFRDLKVFIPNGWEADNIGYFKYDGSKYQLKKCLKDFNSDYVYLNDYVEKWLRVKSDVCIKRNQF